MSIFLQTIFTKPQEREFEAWIIHCIEEYFEQLGTARYAVWAVSPNDEAYWPADEALAVGCKLVGLQFKQAKLENGPLLFDRLKWTLHQPPGQFGLIQGRPEIYYCFPTFINRKFRRRALDHCIFWRPGSAVNFNVWYDNPRARTPYRSACESMRWGRFIERILSCEIGIRINSVDQANTYIRAFNVDLRKRYAHEPRQNIEALQSEITYFIAIQYEGKPIVSPDLHEL